MEDAGLTSAFFAPGAESQPGRVSFETGDSGSAEFARILDGYRNSADRLDQTVDNIVSEQSGATVNPQIKQLVDLYSYAVDTQLIVRTSSQLSTGMRQLMSGQ